MAYKQVKKYGYRDSLEKGDPEKVIYGVDFDAEFEAIEQAFDGVPGAGGDPIAPETPGFEDVVFQTRTEDQQVISKFTFSYENPLSGVFAEIDASNQSFNLSSLVQPNDDYQPWTFDIRGTMRAEAPITMSNATTHMNFASNGMGLDITDTGEPFPNDLASPAYVQYSNTDNKWKIKPELDVEGDLNVDNNITIGGQIEGDLTVNGNIIIDGGTITQPGGEPIEGPWHIEDDGISYKGLVADPNYAVYISSTGDTEFFASVTCSTLESRFWKCTSQDAMLVITSDNLAPYHADGSVGKEMDLGASAGSKWRSGYFSGTVNAGDVISGASVIAFAGGNTSNGINATASATSPYQNALSHTDYGLEFVSNSSSRAWKFKNAGGDRLAIDATGNATFSGTVTANAIVSKGNVTAYSSSDERLKDDITPMPVGLIDAINASQWKWKEDGRSSGGVVAQQLQEIGLDDWVREAPNGDLGVDYNALIGMLIAEVQDLKRRLADG